MQGEGGLFSSEAFLPCICKAFPMIAIGPAVHREIGGTQTLSKHGHFIPYGLRFFKVVTSFHPTFRTVMQSSGEATAAGTALVTRVKQLCVRAEAAPARNVFNAHRQSKDSLPSASSDFLMMNSSQDAMKGGAVGAENSACRHHRRIFSFVQFFHH